MILGTVIKQPSERKDYGVSFVDWLTDAQDSLDDLSVAVVCLSDPLDTALVVESDPPMTATDIKLWVTGGTAGYKYKVTLQITTVAGRIDESELIFKIKDF